MKNSNGTKKLYKYEDFVALFDIKRKFMPKHLQNLIILIEPPENPCDVSFKGGQMCLNLFTIDENAAFDLSGVHYLKKSSWIRVCESKGKGN